MKLYYMWDAYCGWCHGFGKVLEDFLNQHPDLELVILSGGLFDQGKPISAYPHIPGANQQIAQIFGVTFGDAYEVLLSDGQLVLNSLHAAAGFVILKKNLPQAKWLSAAITLQESFYHKGLSLSDPATYGQVATAFGLDGGEIAKQVEQAFGEEAYLEDIQLVRTMGVTSYPTLLLNRGERWYDLRQGALTAAELERNFQNITRN